MIDWTDAFDNSSYVPGSDKLGAHWADQALTYRKTLGNRAQMHIRYGQHDREVYDLFTPETQPQGTLIFVHGGYWHLFDKSYWSHLAKGPMAHGWAVAMPSYPLAPDARIADITQSITRAVTHIASHTMGPLRLAGHSAGGHLVSRMLCPDTLDPATRDRIEKVTSISGLHDLLPLTHALINDTLNLTEDEAIAESAARHDSAQHIAATFWVGAAERPEFLRQTRLIAERWSAHNPHIKDVYEPGHHHFSVINGLIDPQSPLTQEVLT